MKYIKNYAYKCKMIVKKSQKQLLFNHIFSHNQTWNILLNQSITQFESNKLLKEPKYITNKEQDNLVKNILTKRNIKYNTKVLQQCRITFNKELKKIIKTFIKGNKSDNGMLKFKSSNKVL